MTKYFGKEPKILSGLAGFLVSVLTRTLGSQPSEMYISKPEKQIQMPKELGK